MKPTWEANGVRLYLGDCLEVLAGIGSVDAVVTDPPYGMGYQSGHAQWANKFNGDGRWNRKEQWAPIKGDNTPFDPGPLLALQRPTALFGANHFAHRLPSSRGWVVWDKLDGKGPSNQADVELIWTNQDRPEKLFSWLWRGMIRRGEANVARSRKLHPNQKPVELIQFLLEYLSVPERAVVVDGYMGSGSTGVACVKTGRGFVGIEIDPGYFEVAVRRIGKAELQPALEGMM